ncbi:MAG: aminoglycoside 6-adenylyltransferase [Caldilineaceae bacterium]|nr:aminoglycoside 6-adenylyltransferase [Caldilineaceae bacterium]
MINAEPADPTLQQLIAWAAAQPLVRAMLLTSTRAIPHATTDRLSDYDVILVVRDIHPFYADRHWLQSFGQVLVGYWDPIQPEPDYGADYFGNVIQFADGLKIDFTFWPLTILQQIVAATRLPAELDAGYTILLDKEQLTNGLPAPTYRAYQPGLPTAEEFQQFVEEFLSDAPYVAKCLWRDELLPMKWALDYDMKHVYLRRLLAWCVAIEAKPDAERPTMPIGALGKGLQKQLSPALWAQLERSYVGADRAENWEALFQTLALFRQAAQIVATALGYSYPMTLDEGVTAYVQKIRQLPPKGISTE